MTLNQKPLWLLAYSPSQPLFKRASTGSLDFCGAKAYNKSMAKGWGSKTAVIRAERVEVRSSNAPDQATLDHIRQKENIALSRTRVATELKSAQNPRYRELLNRTLADLDAKLSALAGN
jgi:hypothetical protein